MTEERFECSVCRGWYPIIFFLRFRTPMGMRKRRGRPSKCKGCRQNEKDLAKAKRRAPSKAKKTLTYHAQQAIARGLAVSVDDFAEKFGWNVAQMAHDIEHAHANGCPYCLQPFSSMGHGLGDVSLDIVDRRLGPYYRTNARWVCTTCNAEKGDMTPEEWEIILRCWREWRRLQEIDIAERWAPDSLFGAVS